MTMNLHHMDAMLNLYLLDYISIHEDCAIKLEFLDVMKLITRMIVNMVKLWPNSKHIRSIEVHLPIN